jgi:hypothetical protein
MYPDDRWVEIFGDRVLYPGLDPTTRKFTDGDFSNPLIKPSHIPAETFNLMLDNMENFIRALGIDPNNTDPEQLKKAMQKGLSPRRVGEIVMLAYEPTVSQLINMRLVPLKGQLLQIALYQDLFDLMYVGDANNFTAPWWYRCHIDGTRSIEGVYFVPVDMSGLFTRAAGQNSYYRTDMNDPMSPPYDGNSIASFKTDTVGLSSGLVGIFCLDNAVSPFFGTQGPFSCHVFEGEPGTATIARGSTNISKYSRLDFTVPRPGKETAPASLSVLFLIAY